ncbi:GNAT family N-acetyltransferase [Aridibaculum aurantiacum]|uniref:GNAT family N-acetyltransferase n=1 Tax=Aridibaculum aurantiacum TaxID=2810307 RepID=UPI001A96951E|nr:GNAT family protein [Aridibaculum aurantiacum]
MIKLEYFTKEDFQQLIDWIDNEDLLANWAGSLFSFPLTHHSLEWYLDKTNDPQTSDAMVYKAVSTDTGKAVGHISLGSISRKNSSARITRVLIGDDSFKGKGLCCKMVTAILKIAFKQLQLHKVSLGVYDFNKKALGCYTKCGFVTEGVMRDVLKTDDGYWSLVEMSILEDEWRALHPK